MRIAIIGAGPSGLAAAHELTSKGISVDIFERETRVGGLSKSISIFGENVELGPHFLTLGSDDPSSSILSTILRDCELIEYTRQSKLYAGGKLFEYPPRPKNIVINFGLKRSVIAIISFLFSALSNRNDDGTVESYIINRTGRNLYRLLFKNYTEKLWGQPCNSISDKFGKTLIGNVNHFNKKIKHIPYKRKETRRYVYPTNGMGIIWDRLKERIEAQGGRFYLGLSIDNIETIQTSELLDGQRELNAKIQFKKQLLLIDSNKKTNTYDFVISTAPEQWLLSILKNITDEVNRAQRGIRFRSVILVYFQIDPIYNFKDHVVFLYEKKIKAVRLTNFSVFRKNFDSNLLMLEYWQNEEDRLWNESDENIIKIVHEDLKEITKKNSVFIDKSKIIRIRNAYPIPDLMLSNQKNVIKQFIKKNPGLITLGRENQENFNYGIEAALNEGFVIANQIIEGHLF